MRIRVRDLKRHFRFDAEAPADQRPTHVSSRDGQQAALDWTDALDSQGRLVRCPVCGCRELFARRDFPQKLGLGIVIAAGVGSVALFAGGWTLTSLAVLLAVVALDQGIAWLFGRCLVCYRCRSEYRGLVIPPDHPAWDLSTGEKYRLQRQQSEQGKDAETKGAAR